MSKVLHNAKRVVIKIGSSLLVDPTSGVKQDWLESLVEDIAKLHARGIQVLLVSSGAIALGRKVLALPRTLGVHTLRQSTEQALGPLPHH